MCRQLGDIHELIVLHTRQKQLASLSVCLSKDGVSCAQAGFKLKVLRVTIHFRWPQELGF